MEALEHQRVEFLTPQIQTIDWFGLVVMMALGSANISLLSEVTTPLWLDAGPGQE